MTGSKVDVSIALDAMGGDAAPEAVIKGADFVLASKLPCGNNVRFGIYGKRDVVLPVLLRYPRVEAASILIDTPDAVLSTDKPSYALRHRRDSSIWRALEDVKNGKVSGVVSSGNTGALMAISRYLLGTLHNVDRPAIATAVPSTGRDFVILDLGANTECSADDLVQFAVMGRAFSRAIIGKENPKIGLLNVGTEEVKGTDVVKKAFALLRDLKPKINFYGYVEADEAFRGAVDVVVTDGFSGNVMLKTSEAVADLLLRTLKEAVSSSFLGKVAAYALRSRVKRGMSRLDPKSYNGAMLLGLSGIVVKSHGSADGMAFAYAISTAVNAVNNDIISKITSEISRA